MDTTINSSNVTLDDAEALIGEAENQSVAISLLSLARSAERIADALERQNDLASLEARIDRLEADRHNHEHDALALEAADAMADANRYQWD